MRRACERCQLSSVFAFSSQPDHPSPEGGVGGTASSLMSRSSAQTKDWSVQSSGIVYQGVEKY